MVDFTSRILDRLREISQSLLTGNPAADMMFFAIILLALFVLVLAFLVLRRSSADKQAPPSGFDRIAGVAGKVERFEMNINSIRTELARDVAFLKNRVADLEVQVAELREHLELEPLTDREIITPADPLDPVSSESSRDYDVAPSVDPTKEEDEDDLDAFIAPPPSYESDLLEAKPEQISEPLKDQLSKTRRGLFDKIKGLFISQPQLDEEMLEELEALLIGADLGVGLVQDLLDELRDEVKSGAQISESGLLASLKVKILNRLQKDTPLNVAISPQAQSDGPTVVMLVGVNGVGKTTTAAKLAAQWHSDGAKVLLVAGDTFRAAAVEQLQSWGERIGVPVVAGAEEAKPSTVVFDAMERARSEKADIVLIDTAGRLHTKSNLMQELEGIKRIVEKNQPEAPHEVLLVVDGTTGQNALSQAKEFDEAVDMTGIVVTKLDGTAKGGIVVAIKEQIGTPIRYIGVGESDKDLRVFEPRAFVDALFDDSGSSSNQLQGDSAHGKTRRRRRTTSGV